MRAMDAPLDLHAVWRVCYCSHMKRSLLGLFRHAFMCLVTKVRNIIRSESGGL